DDPGLRRRPADSAERFVSDLALHERDVEPPVLEQRDVLGAALGVTLLDRERWIRLVDGIGERGAIHGKAAAWCRGAEHDDGLRCAGHGGYPTTSPRYTPAGRNPMRRIPTRRRGPSCSRRSSCTE